MDLELEVTEDKSEQALMPLANNPPKAMVVWEFYEAPDWVRAHSTHGGDEDGIVWIPNGVKAPWWVEKLWQHYGDGIDAIKFSDGMLVIWSH